MIEEQAFTFNSMKAPFFRDIQLPGPTSHFPTKTTAEKQALKEARQWVDRRLRDVKIFGR